jgi:hypothetical protein
MKPLFYNKNKICKDAVAINAKKPLVLISLLRPKLAENLAATLEVL